MSQSTTIFLLRHAQSRPDQDVPNSDWPLSELGLSQAEALVKPLSELGIDQVFSSPYRRALETVAPFARAVGLEVTAVPDLREHENHLTGSEREFRSMLQKMWTDFDYRADGGETFRECQARVVQAVKGIAEACRGRTPLVSSHGNAIGVFLNHLHPNFGYEDWRHIRNPDLIRIEYVCDRFKWDSEWAWDSVG